MSPAGSGGELAGALRRALAGAGPAVLPVGGVPQAPPWALAELGVDEDRPADPVAAVVLTSGSTGAPRPVALPASSLLAAAAASHDGLGGSGSWLLALPGHTVAGLMVAVRSLVAGTSPAVLDLSDGFRAERFTAAADKLHRAVGGRRYTALVPTQLGRLLSAGEAATAALRRFDAVLVGGAALPEALRARALAADIQVVSTYGMTETCGGCVYDGVPLPGVLVAVEPVAADTPAQEQQGSAAAPATAATGAVPAAAEAGAVPAAAEAGAALAAGVAPATGAQSEATPIASVGQGRLLLGGPVLAAGYRTPGGGLDTERFVRHGGQRWFRSDDSGRLSTAASGRPSLTVLGRLDDAVLSGGTTVALPAVEQVLASLPGVEGAAAAGVPDREWGERVVVALQCAPGRAPDEATVRSAVVHRLGRAAAPRTIVVVEALPLLGVGKPDRGAIRELALGQGDATAARGTRHDGATGLGPGKES